MSANAPSVINWNMCFVLQTLDASECMYAVSQGALAVECRTDDRDTLKLLSELSHFETLVSCIAERAFLKKLVRIFFFFF